jgi:glycosyltransferase involved in cell wall biosynthesis
MHPAQAVVVPPASAMSALRSLGTEFGPVIFWLHNNLASDVLDSAFRLGLARAVSVSRAAASVYDQYPWWRQIDAVPYALRHAVPSPRRSEVPAKRVVFIGAPCEAKGFHHLLAAWPLVVKAQPGARLHVFGSMGLHTGQATLSRTGVMTAEFEQRFWEPCLASLGGSFGSITLHGSVTREVLYDELSLARVAVVNPNTSGSTETFCLSAVEAQACGVPVVGGGADALRETVSDGRSGLLVKTQAKEELARCICSVLGDDAAWRRLSIGAEAHAQQYIAPEVEAHAWLSVIERTLSRRGAKRARTARGWMLGVSGAGRMKLLIKRRMRTGTSNA